jgi:hypothetical protein
MERIIGSFEADERAMLADLLERLTTAIDDVVAEIEIETRTDPDRRL